MFGFGWGFRLSLDFYHRGLHTHTAVARNPCVSWAFCAECRATSHNNDHSKLLLMMRESKVLSYCQQTAYSQCRRLNLRISNVETASIYTDIKFSKADKPARKRVCDFQLVINSNLGPILHRFGDTVVYWSKNRQNCQFLPTPRSLINRPRSG